MRTLELIKKAGIVKINSLNVETIGEQRAIEIAINNNVATSEHNRIASGLICKRAAEKIYKNGNYTL